MEKYELPAETAKKFALAKGAPPVFVNPKHGHIDIRTLGADKAEQLIKAGCDHIIPVLPVRAVKLNPPEPATEPEIPAA
jgi:hypothetical protein